MFIKYNTAVRGAQLATLSTGVVIIVSNLISKGGHKAMIQYYVTLENEKNIGWHIPFTPYFFYRDSNLYRIWSIVEKELSSIHAPGKPYAYRFI